MHIYLNIPSQYTINIPKTNQLGSKYESSNMNPRGILSLYLQGSPGTYKTTTLLTMLGENRTILIRHKDKDKAKYYRPEIHKALIWDDVSFIHLPRTLT